MGVAVNLSIFYELLCLIAVGFKVWMYTEDRTYKIMLMGTLHHIKGATNLIDSSQSHMQLAQKIMEKSVRKLLSYTANIQTARHRQQVLYYPSSLVYRASQWSNYSMVINVVCSVHLTAAWQRVWPESSRFRGYSVEMEAKFVGTFPQGQTQMSRDFCMDWKLKMQFQFCTTTPFRGLQQPKRIQLLSNSVPMTTRSSAYADKPARRV